MFDSCSKNYIPRSFQYLIKINVLLCVISTHFILTESYYIFIKHFKFTIGMYSNNGI